MIAALCVTGAATVVPVVAAAPAQDPLLVSSGVKPYQATTACRLA
ncbi:hypothetical protein [Streptomyces sp. NPDC003943]